MHSVVAPHPPHEHRLLEEFHERYPRVESAVYTAIHAGNPDAPLLAILQLDTLSKFAMSDNATVLVPYESAALMGAAQALRSMIAGGPSADDAAPARK